MTEDLRFELRQHLERRGLKQADLARITNKTRHAISRALGDGNDSPTMPRIWQEMLDALDLELTLRPRSNVAGKSHDAEEESR